MKVFEYLTPLEAAQFARCHRNRIYLALHTGELKGFQRKRAKSVKGSWLIDPADLDRWIRDE